VEYRAVDPEKYTKCAFRVVLLGPPCLSTQARTFVIPAKAGTIQLFTGKVRIQKKQELDPGLRRDDGDGETTGRDDGMTG
jgi:hypothetical protein